MKISTKGRYALRMMLDLAANESMCYVPLREIAQRQKISVKYLEQIVSSLAHSDLVQSMRGAQGGYRLSRKAADYTVGEILRLTEGGLVPVACLDPSNVQCERCDDCATVEIWRRLDAAINEVVDNITLADLIEIQQQKAAQLAQQQS